jgi:hypothetical protein
VPPFVGAAVNVIGVPAQTVIAGVVTATDAALTCVTVMVIGAEVAVAGVAQVALDVIVTLIASPLVNALVV